MLLLISPAKTLDYTGIDYEKYSEARLLNFSDKLMTVLKKKISRPTKETNEYQ